MTELASSGNVVLTYQIALSHEESGNWIAQIECLDIRVEGASDIAARSRVEAEALRQIADRIEREQIAPDKICFEVWLG